MKKKSCKFTISSLDTLNINTLGVYLACQFV